MCEGWPVLQSQGHMLVGLSNEHQDALCLLLAYTSHEGFAFSPRSLVEHSSPPSAALLILCVVHCMWQSVQEGKEISHEDLKAARELSAMATALCSPGNKGREFHRLFQFLHFHLRPTAGLPRAVQSVSPALLPELCV